MFSPRCLAAFCFVGCLVLSGCGSSADSDLGNGGAGSVRSVFSDVLLKVRIQLTGSGASEQAFPDEVARFRLEVWDGDDQRLTEPVEFDRAYGQTEQEQLVQGLSGGALRVVLTSLDAQGHFLGTSEAGVLLSSNFVEVALNSGLFPGPTREVGRISVGPVETNGPSTQPAVSSDARFVAFASAATNLIPGVTEGNSRFDVFRRDRQAGVTERVSVDFIREEVILVPRDQIRPDISGDGRFVVYQVVSGVVGSALKPQIVMRDMKSARPLDLTGQFVSVGVSQVEIVGGLDPKISEDGSIVAYTALLDGLPSQIAVFDRTFGTTRLISRAANGAAANGDCAHPFLSKTGRRIFFSTTATNLDSGGQGGLVMHELDVPRTTALGVLPSPFAGSASRDGTEVAVNLDNHLLVVDVASRVVSPLPAPFGFSLQGAPSMSGDGRFVTFASPQSELVSNDQNQAVDVFVLNRSNGSVNRVNLSNDGTAALGGVDVRLPGVRDLISTSEGPVLSREGGRVAFASADRLLVPNDANNVEDVFSSVNPTPGILYVATGNVVRRFKNVAESSGAATADAVITSPNFLNKVYDLYLDTSNDRLYVLAGNTEQTKQVVVLDGASRLNGSVAGRVRLISGVGQGLFVDVGRNLLYAGNQILNNANGLLIALPTLPSFGKGPGPLATAIVPGTPTAILVDTRANQALYGDLHNADVVVRSGGLVPPPTTSIFTRVLKVTSGPGAVRGMVPDVALPSPQTPGISRFFALCDGRSNIMDENRFHRLSLLLNPFFFDNPSVLSFLAGPLSLLGQSSPGQPVSQSGPLVIDSFNGQIYASNSKETRLMVYNNGNSAPSRILELGVIPSALVLDRTR